MIVTPPSLRAFRELPGAYFKFVVVEPGDLEEVGTVVERHGLPRDRVLLMPEGVTPDAVRRRGKDVEPLRVGRPVGDVETALQDAAQALALHPPARHVVVGVGYQYSLIVLIVELSLGVVEPNPGFHRRRPQQIRGQSSATIASTSTRRSGLASLDTSIRVDAGAPVMNGGALARASR